MAGRPKTYNNKQVAEIVEKLTEYVADTTIPIIAEFAYQNDIPRHALYDYDELRLLVEIANKKSGKSNKKKYKYGVGESASLARYRQDIKHRLKVAMTARIRAAMVANTMRGTTASKLRRELGYSITELKKHIEAQFKDNMSWDNYGEWHIDHIKPVKCFDYKSVDDDGFGECWALNNLQPLWAADNISKGDSYVETC